MYALLLASGLAAGLGKFHFSIAKRISEEEHQHP